MGGNQLLLCLFGISACFLAVTAINNGEKARVDQFPYHVLMQVDGGRWCGGGIIGDLFVLTTAHCVVDDDGQSPFSGKSLTVVVGTNDFSNMKDAVTVRVAKIYMQQNYFPRINAVYSEYPSVIINDIAVLKLENPLGLSSHKNLQQLQLPMNPHETYVGETVIISGFGGDWAVYINETHTDYGFSDTELRFAEADVLSNEQCEQMNQYRIFEKQMCAKIRQHDVSKPSGVCGGDSGGPLVHNGNTIVGVLSSSPGGCSDQFQSSVYTKVSSYLDFVQNVMNGIETEDMLIHVLIP